MMLRRAKSTIAWLAHWGERWGASDEEFNMPMISDMWFERGPTSAGANDTGQFRWMHRRTSLALNRADGPRGGVVQF